MFCVWTWWRHWGKWWRCDEELCGQKRCRLPHGLGWTSSDGQREVLMSCRGLPPGRWEMDIALEMKIWVLGKKWPQFFIRPYTHVPLYCDFAAPPSRNRICFLSPWTWAVLATCFGQQNVRSLAFLSLCTRTLVYFSECWPREGSGAHHSITGVRHYMQEKEGTQLTPSQPPEAKPPGPPAVDTHRNPAKKRLRSPLSPGYVANLQNPE